MRRRLELRRRRIEVNIFGKSVSRTSLLSWQLLVGVEYEADAL